MSHSNPLSRRVVLAGGAALAAGASLGCATAKLRGTGQSEGISYFARFGIDEALLRATLSAALSRGGDHADVFVQHKVLNTLALEDGEVNRAFANVELGAGVRVVKGDQQGYAYSEDLSLESLTRAAQAAASIADGPAREVAKSFRVESGLPRRYPLNQRWEESGCRRSCRC